MKPVFLNLVGEVPFRWFASRFYFVEGKISFSRWGRLMVLFNRSLLLQMHMFANNFHHPLICIKMLL